MSPCNIHSFTNNSDTCDSSIIDDEHNIHYQKHHTSRHASLSYTILHAHVLEQEQQTVTKQLSIKEHCRKMRLHDVLLFY